MTAESPAFRRAIGSRSPRAAHARIWDAISAFMADVRTPSGIPAATSSRTAFINLISSGNRLPQLRSCLSLLGK
jgi:hypothetical protein